MTKKDERIIFLTVLVKFLVTKVRELQEENKRLKINQEKIQARLNEVYLN